MAGAVCCPRRLATPAIDFHAAARLLVALVASFLGDFSAPAWATVQGPSTARIEARVVKDGDNVTVDAVMNAPVPPRQAWDVLCDFDHMAQFVPNMQFSRVISSPGEPLVVAQKGVARYGPFQFSYDTERAVELTPEALIRTRLMRGNMRKMDSTMRLRAEGTGTMLVYHSESIAGFWLPPLLSQSFIRHEVEEQFGAIIEEMKRRDDTRQTRRAGVRPAVAAMPVPVSRVAWVQATRRAAAPQGDAMVSARGR